jgi:hypothetical protein
VDPVSVVDQLEQKVGILSSNFEVPKYGGRRIGEARRIDDADTPARNGDYLTYMLRG